jgi:hypothetical protein
MKQRPRPPLRFVYVIGPASGHQKVGLATDPRSRLATLQTACPFTLVIHAAVPVPFVEAHEVERRAHRALSQCKVLNEWFDTTPEAAVAAVRAAARVSGGDVVVPSDHTALPLFAFSGPRPAPAQSRAPAWRAIRDACRRAVDRI